MANASSAIRVPVSSQANCTSPPSQTGKPRPVRDGRQKNEVRNGGVVQDTLPSNSDATIFALSSGSGRAAIAVIRVSGPACVEIYHALCPRSLLPKPRYAAVRTIYDPRGDPTKIANAILDPGALVLFFPGPKSVTGEDVLEFHVHGGPAVVNSVLTAISHAKGAASSQHIRYAEPGEFTRRAFLNDRLDLVQVESLGDTLDAVTEQQRKLSVRGSTSSGGGGGLSKRYEAWREQLLRARAELEALIDFSEDQHFDEAPASLAASVARQVFRLGEEIRAQRDSAMRGELLRSGINISLLGAPNAGKSSLLNCILGREAAIVSREEGTTRDVIEVGLDIGGFYCRLGDMAGLRDDRGDSRGIVMPGTEMQGGGLVVGEVEREGIRRAKSRALESDVVIVVLSVEKTTTSGDDAAGGLELRMNADVMETAARCSQQHPNITVIVNKIDRLRPVAAPHLPAEWTNAMLKSIPNLRRDRIFSLSCKWARESTPPAQSDPGKIQAFMNGLTEIFKEMTCPVVAAAAAAAPPQHPQGLSSSSSSSSSDIPNRRDHSSSSSWEEEEEESLGATKRQRLLLEDCLSHLDRFLSQAGRPGGGREDGSGTTSTSSSMDVVVAAESLRAAADSLAKITGKGEAGGDVEEVLGVVFEKKSRSFRHDGRDGVSGRAAATGGGRAVRADSVYVYPPRPIVVVG
ncbi:MAG: mitochondrial splicing system protein [Peltula sp. TS41687]|nr:MAG: mitochondrial splicing system protein [Peltula sp. TS41687]